MYSLVRIDNARIVHVGFLSACDTKGPPSATNKFLQSCAWHQRFVTEVFGSSPMRAPPSSWMMTPPARSEEHTSELQSHSDLVCRLLLEKKKKKQNKKTKT